MYVYIKCSYSLTAGLEQRPGCLLCVAGAVCRAISAAHTAPSLFPVKTAANGLNFATTARILRLAGSLAVNSPLCCLDCL